jgi:hypothetical protein
MENESIEIGTWVERMGNMTLDEMEALLARHEEAEFALDLDATMATLGDNPVYELPALGWHIEGQEAVREMYRRMLPGGEDLNMWAEKRVHALDDSSLCREAYVYWDGPDGRTTGRYMAVIAFEDDRIAGERLYMCDRFAIAMAGVLGADFGDVPGVSRLEDRSPAPVPRLDRAAVHAANPDH